MHKNARKIPVSIGCRISERKWESYSMCFASLWQASSNWNETNLLEVWGRGNNILIKCYGLKLTICTVVKPSTSAGLEINLNRSQVLFSISSYITLCSYCLCYDQWYCILTIVWVSFQLYFIISTKIWCIRVITTESQLTWIVKQHSISLTWVSGQWQTSQVDHSLNAKEKKKKTFGPNNIANTGIYFPSRLIYKQWKLKNS